MPNESKYGWETLKPEEGVAVPEPEAPQGSPEWLSKVGEQFRGTTDPKAVEDGARRIPNAVGMGMVGGVPGALAGAAMDPAQAPMTDLGALFGEVGATAAMGRFKPAAGIFAKMAANAAGTAVGGGVGAVGDKKANLVQETPFGQVALYSGMSAAGLGLSAMMTKRAAGQLVDKSEKIRELTGVTHKATQAGGEMFEMGYPLAFGEANPSRAGLSSFLTRGSKASEELGRQQSAYAEKAFEKIMGQAWRNVTETVEGGLSAKRGLKQAITDWKAGNTVNDAGKYDWDKMAMDFGLSAEEKSAMFKAARTDPEQFVDAFIGNESSLKGLFGLRAASKMLPPKEQADLGKAVVFRVLAKKNAFIETSEGLVLSGDRFHKALFKDFGEAKLTLALGKEQTEALKTLSELMRDTDPAKKVLGSGYDKMSETLSYAMNKAMFYLSSSSGGAMAGSQIGANNVLGTGLGMGVGMTAAVALHTVLSRTLSNPWIAKGMKAASMGDQTAANKVLRVLMSPDAKETGSEEKTSSPASRLPIFGVQ
jgi:hypothetical protein